MISEVLIVLVFRSVIDLNLWGLNLLMLYNSVLVNELSAKIINILNALSRRFSETENTFSGIGIFSSHPDHYAVEQTNIGVLSISPGAQVSQKGGRGRSKSDPRKAENRVVVCVTDC